jgi:hypothetical protein
MSERRQLRAALSAVLIMIASSAGVDAQTKPTPQEAGLRYGQASGVAAACPSTVMTPKAEALTQLFKGTDHEAFKAEAAKTFEVWTQALGCANIDAETGRQNATCRHLKTISCRQAYGEIGPEGTAMPGLLDQTFAR